MNAEIWFFFTPDGKHEITVLDKESAVEVATLMSPDQRRQWKCRRNRSQEAWFVHDCQELGQFQDHSQQPRHAPVHAPVHDDHSHNGHNGHDQNNSHNQQHNAATNEEAMGNYLNDLPQHSSQQWQPPQGQNSWQAPQQTGAHQQQPATHQQQPAAHQPPPQPQYQQPPQQAYQPPQPMHQPRQPKQPTGQHPVMPPPQQPKAWQQPAAPQARQEMPPAPMPMKEESAGGREKRRHQRIGLRLRVVLIAGNRSFRTYSKDVSKGGMSFEHIVPKELIGQECKVIIGSSDMKENLEFEAHIAGDANNPRAVEFHNAKDEFRRKLDTWLADAKKNAA